MTLLGSEQLQAAAGAPRALIPHVALLPCIQLEGHLAFVLVLPLICGVRPERFGLRSTVSSLRLV